MIGPILTHKAYVELKARLTLYEVWRAGRTTWKASDTPEWAPTNDERSTLEVYEFIAEPPDVYMVYVSEAKRLATTWTGDALGRVEFGPAFRDNLGSTRVPVRVHGINGLEYHGTYYKSAGDYARIRRAKRQPEAKMVQRRKRAWAVNGSLPTRRRVGA